MTGPAAVVLGSAFSSTLPAALEADLSPFRVATRFGPVQLHRHRPTQGVVLFRHGRPHRLLPHQIAWRANTQALADLGVRALLLTSSVGQLDPSVPGFVPHLAGDLLMPDNRLPDGTMCTMWPTPTPGQAHLVVDQGLFDPTLGDWVAERFDLPDRRLTFAYVPGPRTKTATENRVLRQLGVEVNSMCVGPEVVLANELGIPTTAVLTGHKESGAGAPSPAAIKASLDRSKDATIDLLIGFLSEAPTVPFGNHLYRFESPP
jgi:5'-methylthioadenosine phosphorylase